MRQCSLTNTTGLLSVTINLVTAYIKLANIAAHSATMAIGVRANSTDYWSGDKTTTGATYTLFTEAWKTKPSIGVAWTVADHGALQIVVKNTDGKCTRATCMYAVVDYRSGRAGLRAHSLRCFDERPNRIRDVTAFV